MTERDAWNNRYASGEYVPRRRPSPYLEEWLNVVPSGRALDVACGAGRNALLLAESGFEVDAVDVSEVAIGMAETAARGRGLQVNWHVSEMSAFPIAAFRYQLITVFRYRDENLWPRLVDGLAKGGWILVEHHFKTPCDVLGPRTPAFRLDPGELLRAFASLRIVHYAETIEPADDPDQRFAIARLAACNGDPGF